MGFKDRVSGTQKRDQHTAKALEEACANAKRGLKEFTVTVHSTDRGPALLPNLVPFVVEQLQSAGFAVAHVSQDDWAYNAHLTVVAP